MEIKEVKKTIKQRGGKSPDIEVTIRTLIPSQERGITREKFHRLLDKASQPIKSEEQSDSKQSGT